ncbi:MAG: ARMT1-like domain-containing protein [Thermodesulfobacteriota bacterium]|nr:ARMT1-like domain-containing protein [Thermodesulfobacteriota bacterium]
MRTFHDCIPCFVKQTLAVLNMLDLDDAKREKTLRAVLQQLSTIDFHLSPPAMARSIHHLIRDISGNPDPFLAEKQRYQKLALQLMPQLEQDVLLADDPLLATVLLAIAGNSIDHGVYHDMTEAQALTSIEQGLSANLQGNLHQFATAINQASSILYLGDNAGEIVLDKLLLKQLPLDKTTFVVRGAPIINDALWVDAEQAGITELVSVITNGDNSPGTILEHCSDQFRQTFNQADLIIAKGQGNYETLSDVSGNIFFLLKAKCPVIASHIGCELGSALLYRRSED